MVFRGKTAGQSQRRGQRGARTRQPAATSPTQKSARRSSMRKSTSVQNPGPATAESSEGPPSSTGVPHQHRAGCNSQDRHGGGGDPRHWQPGPVSRRRRSCDNLHNTGDSGSDREAWTGTPFHSGARCFQRQGGSKRHGVLVPAVHRQELPPAVPVRFYYTGPALRGFVPCVNCR